MCLDTAAADMIADVQAVVCAQHGHAIVALHVCAEHHALQHVVHNSLCTTTDA